MAETAITAALSKFGELAASEAKILLEVGDNMTLLRDRLEWLQAFIRDADRRRRAGTDDQLTRVWVRQTRDVSFQAEDALDEFVYQVDLKSQGYRRWKKMWLKYLFGFYTQIVSRHTMSARITRINMRLAKIAVNQKEYNIGHTPLATVTSSTTATSAWSDDAVGFDDDVMKLKQMLLSKDHTRQMFISILGESGVGKETLATILSDQVNAVFDVFICLNVPQDSTVDVVLHAIYEMCTGEGLVANNLHLPKKDDGIVDITDKLRSLLIEKRYLVILGGISSKTIFNCLMASLPDDNNGSRVLLLLDIESEEVAWHANSMNQEGFNGIHMLTRLDEKRSGLLFRSRAFRIRREEVACDGGSKEDKERYDNIVYDITGGYPLAIVVLAGLLRFKERPGQWEAVLQQLRPGPEAGLVVQSGDGEGSNNQISPMTHANHQLQLSTGTTTTIERVFWANYDDLPNDLKSCFLYFVATLNNTSWNASQLINMWMAEGFIKPQKGKSMEDLGYNYLKELDTRCLVQIKGMDKGTNDFGGIASVSIHPRLHGFLQSEAREAGFMEVHDMHHVFVPPSVRRLSFTTLGGRYTPFTNKFPKLRSFFCWVREEQHVSPSTDEIQGNADKNKKHWHDLSFLCGSSKFLRVLYTQGLRIEALPKWIGNMINLRFLSIDCKDLKELPSSIKRLLNLQTLDISGTQVKMIDPGFWKIRTLRHVVADELILPETVEKELEDLQTLDGVKPPTQGGEWKEQNCPLHKMPNLRTLKLHGIEYEKHGAALASALMKMHLLGDLSLKGDVIPSCVFTAPSLRFLQKLELVGNIREWPEVGWDASKIRPNLTQIQMSGVPQHILEELLKIRKRNGGAPGEVEETH